MTVTLQDIAQRAGVSRSTVSRALNGQGRMSEATRQHIQSLAQEMGYIPNFLAQSLHEDKTKMIGVVITSVSDPFNSELVEGIEQVADSDGYTIFLGASRFDSEKEIETILKFYQRRVDGIIVQTAHMTDITDPRIARIDVPIVLINNETGLPTNNVTIDSRAEVRQAVTYLFEIGHRRIAYIGSPVSRLSTQQRLLGYQDALMDHGQPFNPAYVLALPTLSDYETGQRALDRLLVTDVTAVCCANDMIAIGLMNACREREIAVPDRLSIMGFDNIDQAAQFYPGLTTVHQPKLELGRAAMQLIQQDAPEPANRVLPCKLIVRESTQAPDA